MTSKELNLRLIKAVPEIKERYMEETSWQDGDETGSHVVFADVLVPFIKKQIEDGNEKLLRDIFAFLEDLLKIDDNYAEEVVVLSVLESLVFDEETDNKIIKELSKEKTFGVLEEILL